MVRTLWDSITDALTREVDYRQEMPGRGGLLQDMNMDTPASVSALQAVGDYIPGYGDVLGAVDLGKELAKENPNYVAAGLLGAGTAVGLIPGAGDYIGGQLGRAGRAIVERANQRGPVRTMYSNPLFGAVDDYAGVHRAPRRSSDNASLDDLTQIYPDDIYDPRVAAQYYGDMVDPKADQEIIDLFQKFRGNPDAPVKVYRAVPKGVDAGINAGDWVTPSREYAERHGEGPLGGDYKIVEEEVKAGDLFTDANSIFEFGYDPAPSLPTPRNDAEAMAKQVLEMRAAGQAGDVTDEMMAAADPQYMYANTPLPMDEASRMARAREMGFDVAARRFHGSDNDISGVNPDLGTGERYRTGFFSSDNPDVADSYASTRGGQILPIITRRNDAGAVIDVQGENWRNIGPSAPATLPGSTEPATAFDVAPEIYQDLAGLPTQTNALARQRRFEGDSNITFANIVDRGPNIKRYLGETSEDQMAREASASQPSNVRVDFYGNQVRSPFARFDPEFRHLRNLSAGIGGAGLLATQPTEQEREAEVRQYLGGLL